MCKHSHAGTGTCSEVEILATTGPGRDARERFSQPWNLNPRYTFDGRVSSRVRRLDGYRSIALDKPYTGATPNLNMSARKSK